MQDHCAVGLVAGGVGCLSIVGATFIVVAFVVDRSKLRLGSVGSAHLSAERKVHVLRDGYLRMLLWLSVADVINSAAWALNLIPGSRTASPMSTPSTSANSTSTPATVADTVADLCTVQGVLMQYGEVCAAMWSACMAHELYRFVVRLEKDVCGNFSRKRHTAYHFLCWGVPLLLALIPVLTGSLGPAGDWCWVREEFVVQRFLISYTPVYICLAVNATCYYLVARHLYRKLNRSFAKLVIYPAVALLVWIFPLVHRILDAASPLPADRVGSSSPNMSGDSCWAPSRNNASGISGGATDSTAGFVVDVLHAVFAPSQGFLNALIYVSTNQAVRSQVYKLLCCSSCCHGGRGEDGGGRSPTSNSPSVTRSSPSHSSATVPTSDSAAGRGNGLAPLLDHSFTDSFTDADAVAHSTAHDVRLASSVA